MEDKIEVGEYIRTDKGYIFKIDKEEKNLQILNFLDVEYGKIVKHGKQLIDLIEDKDIVGIELSEEFVEKKDKKKLIQIGDIYTKETLQKDIDNGIITRILTILSYNQYIANCYKVGGDEDETSND